MQGVACVRGSCRASVPAKGDVETDDLCWYNHTPARQTVLIS